MTNTDKIPRAYVALGVCLPLAILLGYLIAEPLENSSIAVLVLVFSVLITPLLMKWYHPLLLLSWNACITPFFFPGQFSLWVLLAAVGFFFALLNRSVNPSKKLIYVPEVANPLLFLSLVVLLTAVLTGGVGLRSLGGSQYGGSRYVYIFAAIAGFFALTSRRIPVDRAGFYAAMFFLPGLTALISNLAYALGPSFYFLYALFPAGNAYEQAMAEYSMDPTIIRFGGLAPAVTAAYGFLLSRYGLQGVLDFSKPIRCLAFLTVAIGSLATGFRSEFILFALVLTVLFYIERLHRTRWMVFLCGLGIALALVVVPYAYKLPLTIQRTLSFLPVNVDPFAETAAKGSSDWRFRIWREVLPEVPKYIFKGKGYSMDPNELQESDFNALDPVAGIKVSGNYHSGPLSILIPLGAFGMLGFVWFLVAGARLLRRYSKSEDLQMRRINTFLFAFFVAKAVSFFFVFGSFYSDLFVFTGIIGFAISLNGMPASIQRLPETPLPINSFESLHRQRARESN